MEPISIVRQVKRQPISHLEARRIQSAIEQEVQRFGDQAKEDKFRHNQTVVRYLIEMRETSGYKALGHTSMTAWLTATFNQPRRRYEQLMKQSDFHLAIFGDRYPPNSKPVYASSCALQPETTTRLVTAQPPEAWEEIWNIVIEKANTREYYGQAKKWYPGKAIPSIAKEAIAEWKQRRGLPTESQGGADGEGLDSEDDPDIPISRGSLVQIGKERIRKLRDLCEDVLESMEDDD